MAAPTAHFPKHKYVCGVDFAMPQGATASFPTQSGIRACNLCVIHWVAGKLIGDVQHNAPSYFKLSSFSEPLARSEERGSPKASTDIIRDVRACACVRTPCHLHSLLLYLPLQPSPSGAPSPGSPFVQFSPFSFSSFPLFLFFSFFLFLLSSLLLFSCSAVLLSSPLGFLVVSLPFSLRPRSQFP